MKKESNFFTHKFLPILAIVLFVSSLLFTSVSFGATYDLSDYQNCELTGGVWVIVYARESQKIYLVTGERSDYRYLLTDKRTNEDGSFYSSGTFVTAQNNSNTWYNAQAGTYVYTFNVKTNKFENRTQYGVGNTFKCGDCDIVASGVNLYHFGQGDTSFFPRTPLPLKVVLPPEKPLLEVAEKALNNSLMKETMGTQLTTLIKVGLIIFGLLLSPFLIKYRI